MRKLFSILSFVLLSVAFVYGQAAVSIPLSGSDGTATIDMAVGLDLTATDCIDPSLGEAELPPLPPAGVFDIRFILPASCGALNGQLQDYRGVAAFPFTGTIQHTMHIQRSTAGLSVPITYDLPTGAVMTITDNITGTIYTSGPLSGAGTFTISGIGAGLESFYVNMAYTNIGPSGPAPIFGIAPPSLDFGSVLVGGNSTLQTTVSNTGTGDLIITNIASSDPEFTFSPNTYPITIAAGNNQVFDVAFAPTSGGPHSANLTFTHNAAGSPTVYAVQGTGVATAPVFGINPPFLNFGNVITGNNAMLQAMVSNTGNADLIISGITASDPAYTFSPNSFPVTVTPGNSQTFDVTFAPVTPGTHNAHLTITHNASGSPTTYNVSGVGIDAGPTFSIDHTSLSFGNVNVGLSLDRTVLVTNTGAANSLVISSAAIAAPEFTVSPANANIAPGASQLFTVTFTPPAEGPYTGTLVFTDNAPGSPHNVSLTGNGYIPPAVYGLIFENEIVHQIEYASYVEKMDLINLTATAQAIQFRLLVNTETDDHTILTFQNITKGTDVADASWILDYNVFRGPINSNGASKDTILVLLYNMNQNGGLTPGDYHNVFNVKYRIADLPAMIDSEKSSIKIIDAQASTFEGNPIDITPSRNDLTVWAKNRVSSHGDVNGDGCLDILDLIMVVDHIVGRDSLTGDFFTRADIAPWYPGDPAPTPDGVVNVQDLALIQNIILSGFYPDGTPLNCSYGSAMPKVTDADAKVTLYISKDGISAYLDSQVGIRGAQIEFGSLSNNPGNLVINTPLGNGYYLKVNDLLRTLMYDRTANKYIDAGEHFMADMPFAITNPEDITIDKIILVDLNRNKIENIQVEIIYGNATLPLDYILFQNYPNPFNPATTVKFQVPQAGNVTVKIYNMLGQEVRTLFASQVQRGTYSVQWDGKNDSGVLMSSGTYVYRMNAGEFVQSKKMVFLK